MKKSVKIAIGAVVVVAAGAAAVSGLKPKNTENETVAPPAVRVENPSNGTIELFRSLIGTIEPADQVYVIPKAAGEITAVYVNPGDYVEEFAKIGVEYFTFHQETVPHMHRLIQHIKQCGMKAGVALNPGTPVSLLEDVAADLDMILIMSVNPGFGGQSFIPNAIKKVKQAKMLLEEVDNTTAVIEVDGGINDITCVPIKRAGATVLVAGSAVFGADERAHMIESIRNN